MEKPENYQSGGKEALTKAVKQSSLQILFILGLFLWVILASFICIKDILGGFQYPLLTSTFIFTIVTGTYLKTKQYLKTKKIFPKISLKSKEKGCSKCGKNK